jgi:uncharacterized protein YggE
MKQRLSWMIVGTLLVASTSAGAAGAQPARTISVSGTAVVKTAPDQVVWRIELADFDKDMRRAKQSNDTKVKAVLDLRRKLDIDERDIETGHLSINREYERGQYGQQGAFKHYAVRRTVTFRQADLTRFDEFLDELVATSEMEVSFSFESSKIHEVRAETRLKALKAANEKAAAMAGVLGARLGPVLTISEHSPDRPFASPMSNAAFVHSPPPVDVATDRFVPGAINVQISVYATFELN